MRGTAVESISKNINVGLVTNFGGDMGERLETKNIMTSQERSVQSHMVKISL